MKINYNRKPTEPDVEQNLKVPYAPAKRKLFQFRWYLILALVVSPFVYVFWSALTGWFMVDAPGYVEIPTYQMFAPQASVVNKILVKENEAVEKGAELIQLIRPEGEKRLEILREETYNPSPKALYGKQVELVRKSLKDYEALYKSGAATIGEVDAARLRLLQVMSMDQRWLTQLADTELSAQNIVIKAPNNSIVIRIETKEGISVQQGDPLITIQEATKPRVIALLAPRFALYARPGQKASVQWESGLEVDATVLFEGTISSRIPEKMRNFKNQNQGIVVQLELHSDIPGTLAVDSLPVKVKFARNLF
jgi:multidrug resistance efflux pump